MSYSYSGNPSTSSLDAVRFLVHDHPVTGSPYLQDEEINWMVVAYPNVFRAAAMAAEAISAIFAGRPSSRKVGDLMITYGDLRNGFAKLADSLRRQALILGVSSFPNAVLSDNDKRGDASDLDSPQPAFRRSTGAVPGTRQLPYVPEAWR